MRKFRFGRGGNEVPDRDQVYKTDRWSQYQWRQYQWWDHAGQSISNVLKEGKDKVYSFPQFAHETFTKLLSPKSTKRLDKIRPEDSWAEKYHDELEALPEWKQLEDKCRGDRVLAGEAAKEFSSEVAKKLPKAHFSDPDVLRDEYKGLLQFADRMREEGQDTQKVEELLKDAQARGRAEVEKAVKYSDQDGTALRKSLKEAVASAHEKVDDLNEQFNAFGWGNGSGGPGKYGSANIKEALANKIGHSEKLKQLAKEAGRLMRIAAVKQRSKSVHEHYELSSVEVGNDLARVLPTEMVKLADPDLELVFFRQFTERNLLQYHLKGSSKEGRGPIVVCVDQSGSMEGKREIWSKAMALALLKVATMQNRACRVIHFEGTVRKVDDWEPGKVGSLDLLESMAVFYNGSGTEFEPPLRSALESITTVKDLKKADVVFLTDGRSRVSESFASEWAEKKKEKEFTAYLVLIASSARGDVSSLFDKTVYLRDVADDVAAMDVLSV